MIYSRLQWGHLPCRSAFITQHRLRRKKDVCCEQALALLIALGCAGWASAQKPGPSEPPAMDHEAWSQARARPLPNAPEPGAGTGRVSGWHASNAPAAATPSSGSEPVVSEGENSLPAPRPLRVGPACPDLPWPAPEAPQAGNAGIKPTPEVVKEYGRFVDKTIDSENILNVVIGRPRLMIFKEPIKRVQTDSEEQSPLAPPLLVTDRELSITGKRLGTTVLYIWVGDPANAGKDRILSFLVRVIPDFEAVEEAHQWQERYYKALEKQINQAFCDSLVCLKLVGNDVIVSGEAKDIAEATQILRIVQNNSPQVRQTAPIPPGQITTTTASTEHNLTGSSTTQTSNATPVAIQSTGREYNIVNLLRVPGEQQVMLKVTVAEVNRAAARSIGVNFSITNDRGITVFSNTTGNIASAMSGGTGTGSGISSGAGGAANLPVLLDNGQISLAINALRTLDFARTLAEPNLVTLNGHPANFRAGGEFPVPVVTGFTAAGLQGVSFVPFGVQLSFTPYITDKNLIRLSVQADVSTKDLASAASVNGTNVPGLNTRNFQTTVELRQGQTLAVAGLIQNNFGADATRVPFFGDLPVVGRMFAFDRTSSGEQELVVLVTPELVHPLDCKETPPLPGSDVFEPGDLEFYLLGRLESRRSYDYRASVRTDLARMVRYRRCETIYIAGPHGYADGR